MILRPVSRWTATSHLASPSSHQVKSRANMPHGYLLRQCHWCALHVKCDPLAGSVQSNVPHCKAAVAMSLTRNAYQA